MDIHPWTKFEIAQTRHEGRLARAMAATRAREIRIRQGERGRRHHADVVMARPPSPQLHHGAAGIGRTGECPMRTVVGKEGCARASRALSLVRASGVDRVVVVVSVALGIAAAHVLGVGPPPAQALPGGSQHAEQERTAPVIEESRQIARELAQRYRHRGEDLVAREISPMNVLETVELMPGLSRPGRTVPAADGVYFAICRRSPCALQRHNLSRERALLARRMALELALRTLDETASDLVVVALPKRWVLTILLVLTRDDLVAGGDGGRALRRWSARGFPADLDVDEVVRQNLYVHGGLAPYSATRDSLLAFPLEARAES